MAGTCKGIHTNVVSPAQCTIFAFKFIVFTSMTINRLVQVYIVQKKPVHLHVLVIVKLKFLCTMYVNVHVHVHVRMCTLPKKWNTLSLHRPAPFLSFSIIHVTFISHNAIYSNNLHVLQMYASYLDKL